MLLTDTRKRTDNTTVCSRRDKESVDSGLEQGTQDAGNVKISLAFDDGASWPFEIADMNNELELGTIPAGQYAEAVWKDLKVWSDVEIKSYKLAFTVTA